MRTSSSIGPPLYRWAQRLQRSAAVGGQVVARGDGLTMLARIANLWSTEVRVTQEGRYQFIIHPDCGISPDPSDPTQGSLTETCHYARIFRNAKGIIATRDIMADWLTNYLSKSPAAKALGQVLFCEFKTALGDGWLTTEGDLAAFLRSNGNADKSLDYLIDHLKVLLQEYGTAHHECAGIIQQLKDQRVLTSPSGPSVPGEYQVSPEVLDCALLSTETATSTSEIWQSLKQTLQPFHGSTPITRLDEATLQSLGVEVPYIRVKKGGSLQMLDHHRIMTAQRMGLPIAVRLEGDFETFN